MSSKKSSKEWYMDITLELFVWQLHGNKLMNKFDYSVSILTDIYLQQMQRPPLRKVAEAYIGWRYSNHDQSTIRVDW